MNFLQFSKVFQNQKVFSTIDIAKEWPDFSYSNLVNWQDKGYVFKLRNTWYAFPDTIKTEADLYFVANRLHRPSYISLETALRYYNFIPESVFGITSVTTAKPYRLNTSIGHFSYRSLKPSMFFGYQPSHTQPDFLISDPEKTLLDLLYFNPHLIQEPDFEGLRLNKTEIANMLDVSKLNNYLSLADSASLKKRWLNLQKYVETT